MTDHTDTPTDESEDRSTMGTSRRDVLRVAGAGAGAVALGASASNSASANQGDGPGQTISTPQLEVDGNVVVDPRGNTVKLRGLNIADPKKLDVTAHVRGKTAIQAIDFLTNRDLGWHPRVIRLPIEPGNVAELTPVPIADDSQLQNGDYPLGEFDESDLEAYCEEHLDDVVDRCEQRNVYCILDYHRHWGGGDFQWTEDGLGDEVEMFWHFVADRYGDRDHVLFEVYNEPTEPGMWSDPLGEHGDNWAETWREWKETAQPWVDTIREYTDNIIIVGSPSWSASPEGALVEPFDGENLMYTYHIYGGHLVSMEQNWSGNEANGGGLAAGGTPVYEEYPVFVTEFGWERTTITDQHIQGTTEEFGEPFVEFLESHDALSWTAWCADPIWRPIMFDRPWVEEDLAHSPAHLDTAGDVYNEDLEVLCEEPPCEWELLVDGHEGMPWMGDTIKNTLAEKRDDMVPGDVSDPDPTPSTPTGVDAVALDETSVEVSWNSVSDATSYNVSLDGDLETTVDADVTSVEIGGLESETAYEVGVEAVNDAGTSSVAATTVTTLGGDSHPCEEAGAQMETLSNGNTVCDLDGDGKYRDLTGSGDTTTQDLQYFFENQHREPYDSRTDLFDFTDNDNVGQPDVVDLFHAI